VIKSDIARAVYDAHGGISHKEAREIVDLILELMMSSLVKGQNVKMSGFGSLNVIRRRGRAGRNPQTGRRIMLKPSYYVTFRPSKEVF
jgi:integration host factor subunit alpha